MMKTALATIALMTSFVALAPAATAQPDLLCPPNNPVAWVNYCVAVVPKTYNVVMVETNQIVYHRVCPVDGRCVNVPTLPSVIQVIQPDIVKGLTVSTEGTSVDGQQMIYDICTIVFGDPRYCNVNQLAFTDLNGDGVMDGIIANNVFLPLGPA